MGGEFGGKWIHVYVWLSLFSVRLKLSQHCLLTGYACVLSCVLLFATLWTVTPPLSMGFSRQEYWSCHFLLQGIFLTQGLNLRLLHSQADTLLLSHLGSPNKLFPKTEWKFFKINKNPFVKSAVTLSDAMCSWPKGMIMAESHSLIPTLLPGHRLSGRKKCLSAWPGPLQYTISQASVIRPVMNTWPSRANQSCSLGLTHRDRKKGLGTCFIPKTIKLGLLP